MKNYLLNPRNKTKPVFWKKIFLSLKTKNLTEFMRNIIEVKLVLNKVIISISNILRKNSQNLYNESNNSVVKTKLWSKRFFVLLRN